VVRTLQRAVAETVRDILAPISSSDERLLRDVLTRALSGGAPKSP
jgi:hypothetical protein